MGAEHITLVISWDIANIIFPSLLHSFCVYFFIHVTIKNGASNDNFNNKQLNLKKTTTTTVDWFVRKFEKKKSNKTKKQHEVLFKNVIWGSILLCCHLRATGETPWDGDSFLQAKLMFWNVVFYLISSTKPTCSMSCLIMRIIRPIFSHTADHSN